jgi:hypothetical protein
MAHGAKPDKLGPLPCFCKKTSVVNHYICTFKHRGEEFYFHSFFIRCMPFVKRMRHV